MLHGEIKVNDKEIWYWQAVRQRLNKGTDSDPVYTYKWYANNLENGEEYEGEVDHYFNDGAIALTSIVMDAVDLKKDDNKERTE